MLVLKLLAVSQMKEGTWLERQKHYSKLLRSYAKMDLVEIRSETFSDPSERVRVLALEEEKIQKQLPNGAVTILLDAKGKTYTSEDFAQTIETWSDGGRTLCFIIGGPLGLSDNLKAQAHHLLSLSPLTFPHDMARIMLLEQLYRASTITAGKTYHY